MNLNPLRWFSKTKRTQSKMRLTSGDTYHAASTSKRMGTWGLSVPGPNTAISNNADNIRKRSRKLRNDNPWVDNGIEALVSNIIGRGITPRWKTGDKGLNKEIKSLWDESQSEMDSDGVLDFNGLQSLAAMALIESGEVLGHIKRESSRSNYIVPITLRLMEPDHLDDSDDYASNGNRIKSGIELSGSGKRVAYHLYRDHPGESSIFDLGDMDTVRVPAKNILHMYKPLRPGQLRGRPWLTTIITRCYQLDQYEDSELKRKSVAAMFAGFLISPDGDSSDRGIPGEETTYNSETVISLETGTMQDLRGTGVEDIKFSNPVDVGQTYEVWIKQQLRAVAAGMGVTYEQLTGDLSGVNYTSIRAGLLEFRRRCRMTQRNIFIHQLCRPWAANWLDAVAMNNILEIKDYWRNRRRYIRTAWDADGWDFTDPLKDAKGKQLLMRLGLQSRSQNIGELGNDPEQLDDEITEDNKRADNNGLVFDSDPRKTTVSGSLQKSEGRNE